MAVVRATRIAARQVAGEALVFPLARSAAEVGCVYTFEGTGYLPEDAHWEFAQDLGAPARKKLVGKPIRFYLDLWDEVRAETLRQLKTKDDTWFNGKAGDSRNMSNHWAWYHVMEHQANHMGQIRLITGRLPQ